MGVSQCSSTLKLRTAISCLKMRTRRLLVFRTEFGNIKEFELEETRKFTPSMDVG